MAPPKKKTVASNAENTTTHTDPDADAGLSKVGSNAPKPAKKTRTKSGLEMPGFPKEVFDAIPAVAKKSGVAQAVITLALKRVYVEAADAAVAGVTLTAQDIAREHLAELQAALDDEE